ncbi:hypothetical protein PHSC3_001227 [Chlamydiales bacterium STE3]|nr:hypothetical protein PHSC3_001227 [Chlamydiales bacterium STE3]
MLKIFKGLSLITIICCSLGDLSAQTLADRPSTENRRFPPLGHEEEEQFNRAMQNAIDQAEKTLKVAQYNATRHDIAPTWNTKLAYQQAITMYEVKKTLMNNFKGTESLRSSAVRSKLLNLLHSTDISTAELADLQSLVLNEKERIREEDQAQVQPQAPTFPQ